LLANLERCAARRTVVDGKVFADRRAGLLLAALSAGEPVVAEGWRLGRSGSSPWPRRRGFYRVEPDGAVVEVDGPARREPVG